MTAEKQEEQAAAVAAGRINEKVLTQIRDEARAKERLLEKLSAAGIKVVFLRSAGGGNFDVTCKP